jgi:hypothetical protein
VSVVRIIRFAASYCAPPLGHARPAVQILGCERGFDSSLDLNCGLAENLPGCNVRIREARGMLSAEALRMGSPVHERLQLSVVRQGAALAVLSMPLTDDLRRYFEGTIHGGGA